MVNYFYAQKIMEGIMSLIIDIVAIVLLLACVLISYKRGMIKCVISLVTVIISLIVAIVFSRPITDFIVKNTNWDDGLQTKIAEVMRINPDAEFKVENMENAPKGVQNYINEKVSTAVKDGTTSVGNAVAEGFTYLIINAIVALLLYFGTRFALVFVKALSTLIEKLPVIHQVNKLGGAIYGVISGFFIIYTVLILFVIIGPLFTSSDVLKSVQESKFCGYLYEHNPYSVFIK
jgi:uncharacterized membrane protein required for colicin V production